MRPRPPRATRTDTLFPYTTLFRSTPLVGKSLADLQALAEGDVTVLAVIRSDSRRLVPSPRYKIEADDVIVLETDPAALKKVIDRSEEHTSELQSLMRNSYAVFCLQKKKTVIEHTPHKA